MLEPMQLAVVHPRKERILAGQHVYLIHSEDFPTNPTVLIRRRRQSCLVVLRVAPQKRDYMKWCWQTERVLVERRSIDVVIHHSIHP